MQRDDILREIRRLAGTNGGKPLGWPRFSAETGVAKSDWLGRYWLRWSQAIQEAGLEPNTFTKKSDEQAIVAALSALIAELGHFPIEAELKMRRTTDPSFPTYAALRTVGKKAVISAKVIEYCADRPDLEGVRTICLPLVANARGLASTEEDADEPDAGSGESGRTVPGQVYLVKSGRHYKIGRSNSFGRRTYELKMALLTLLWVMRRPEGVVVRVAG